MKSVNDIRESGILEEYVLGLLDESGVKEVESYLEQFPELKKDYLEIQLAMQKFAKANAVEARKGFSSEITEYIKNNTTDQPSSDDSSSNDSKRSNLFKLLSLILGIALVGSILLFLDKVNALQESNDELSQELVACDSISNEQEKVLNTYGEINSLGYNKFNFTPTAKYQNIELILHSNSETQKNYLQIINLPTIEDNQAFQLWSLKDGLDPIPMDVFTLGNENIIPLRFENGTSTYAITIERSGGSPTPNLEELIGTTKV